VTVVEAYDVLGLDGARASADEIRARFRDLIRANHPDRAPLDQKARANEVTRTLVEAYALLRERGYPRVDRTAGTWSYEPQEEPMASTADPFAWVEELWRDGVRRGAPENAVTSAVLGAASRSIAALALLALGVVVLAAALLAGQWIAIGLALVAVAFAIRLAAAASRIVGDVRRFWTAWARVADRTTRRRARRKLAARAALAILIFAALVVGARLLPRAFA
jgi:hypothetical protein